MMTRKHRFTCNTEDLHDPRNVELNEAGPFRCVKIHQTARYRKTLSFFRYLSNHYRMQDNDALKYFFIINAKRSSRCNISTPNCTFTMIWSALLKEIRDGICNEVFSGFRKMVTSV